MDGRVHVISRREVFNRSIFRIDEVQLQHKRFDGSMSPPINRLVLDRGDSVAILLHDPQTRVVLLCEQFRLPTCDRGPGWLLEIPAGMLESGEDAEVGARRETFEETGYAVSALDAIASVYLSPGGSSERVHIFYGAIAVREDVGETAGVEIEGEDIRVVRLSVDDALARARAGEILDAKTLIALQWLALKLNSGAA